MEDDNSTPPMQKILIVEDEPDVADLVSFNLERAGFQIAVAHDGLIGLQMALVEKPDLSLLDLMMPGLDGIEVLRRLRESEACKAVPVIMLSARTQQDEIDDGLSLGAADYLVKPVESKAVIASVERLLPLRPTESSFI